MHVSRFKVSNVGVRSGYVEDRAYLALLRRLLEETGLMIKQSLAAIEWSREAIAQLDRLQPPQNSN